MLNPLCLPGINPICTCEVIITESFPKLGTEQNQYCSSKWASAPGHVPSEL